MKLLTFEYIDDKTESDIDRDNNVAAVASAAIGAYAAATAAGSTSRSASNLESYSQKSDLIHKVTSANKLISHK